MLNQISTNVEVALHARSRIVSHGRPSGHVALDHARKMIAGGEAPYVMIAGVDSYLTPQSMIHHFDKGRLLTPNNPNGFIPGEAAGAVLCAKAGTGSPRIGNFGLYGLGLTREPGSIYNVHEVPLRADGMTSAYDAALRQTGIEMNRVG